jgi:thiol-disulfide isomerase/thioredoxin
VTASKEKSVTITILSCSGQPKKAATIHRDPIMPLKKQFLSGLVILLALFNGSVQAEPPTLELFATGSYQKILTNHANQPFMLVAWSITCSSCLKDMALLSQIHQKRPELKIIMLATDDISEADQIKPILEKNQLSELENWVYADENTQKLQFEIDPKWYGELPRTYFFDKTQQREGISGVLSEADYESRLSQILK